MYLLRPLLLKFPIRQWLSTQALGCQDSNMKILAQEIVFFDQTVVSGVASVTAGGLYSASGFDSTSSPSVPFSSGAFSSG